VKQGLGLKVRKKVKGKIVFKRMSAVQAKQAWNKSPKSFTERCVAEQICGMILVLKFLKIMFSNPV